MVKIHSTGNWARGAVSVEVVPSTRRIIAEVEAAIEVAWRAGQARLGARLFDGPMCRMESWSRVHPGLRESLRLKLSITSYRIFYGTNLNPAMSQRYGTEVCANPVGISSALLTRDNWVLFGRRNSNVAYYPNRVHPFAGALEEKDLRDVFGAMERELNEELHLSPLDIESIRCIGIAEDETIRHPELIFRTRVHLAREQLESQIHDDEHLGGIAIKADSAVIERALKNPDFTPIAVATLALLLQSQPSGIEGRASSVEDRG